MPVTAPDRLVTHVRLTIYPDGGVARLRVFGEVVPDPRRLGGRVDLAATAAGGWVEACSNMFFSAPANVLAPGRAQVMSDGWETARRRDDGHDWLVVRLAVPGLLHHAVIDTSRFAGNAPGHARLSDAESGAELLPRTRLIPDAEHRFRLRAASPGRPGWSGWTSTRTAASHGCGWWARCRRTAVSRSPAAGSPCCQRTRRPAPTPVSSSTDRPGRARPGPAAQGLRATPTRPPQNVPGSPGGSSPGPGRHWGE